MATKDYARGGSMAKKIFCLSPVLGEKGFSLRLIHGEKGFCLRVHSEKWLGNPALTNPLKTCIHCYALWFCKTLIII